MTVKTLIGRFPDSKWTWGLVCVPLLGLTTGFVHAPFPQWAVGELLEINPEKMTLVIRDDNSRKPLSVRWDEETRLWSEPAARNDRGVVFAAKDLAPGTQMRIMFKKYSDYNLVKRVIRQASSESAP